VPGRSLSMQLLHDAGRFSSDVVAAIGDQLVALLTELPHSGDVRLMRLMDRLERHRTALEAHAYQSVRDKLWQRTRDKRHAQTSES